MSVTTTATATSNTPSISSPGIGSGLDVNGIVTKLMAVEQRPVTLLDKKEADFQAKLSAVGTLKGALSSLQTAAEGIGSISPFQNFAIGSSATSVLTGSASANATPGTYNVQVSQLAQAQSLTAAGQTTTTAPIGTGAATTLSFEFGSITGGTLAAGTYTGASFTPDANRGSGTVTIDASNNSLAGIRDAINAAKVGVNASIVSDGSASPQRLVLTSSSTGAKSALKITASGDAAVSTLLSNDPAGTQNLTQAVAAQDAQLTVNGVAISSASNNVTGAVTGVGINLFTSGTSTLTITPDSSAVQSGVQNFVKAFNGLVSSLQSVAGYNATTGVGGPLLGDFGAQTVQSQLRGVLDSALPGLATGGVQTLAEVGVTFQKDGTLALDSSKLASALSANVKQVAQLFAAAGVTSDSLVGFTSSTPDSKAGTYAVHIASLATQASAVGSASAGLTITAGTNDQLTVNLSGTAASIVIPAGTYTAQSLAAQVQSSLNGTSALSGLGGSVSVSASGAGVLTLSSTAYGSSSTVSVTGTAAATIFGATPLVSAGKDVVGTIGGFTATGSGQTLTGGAGGLAAGLKLAITGGSTGSRGTVAFSQGYASRLDSAIGGLLASKGVVDNETTGLNALVKDVGNRRTQLNSQLALVQARYLAQFNKLDTLIAQLQSTQSFLTQQLGILTTSTTSNKTTSG